MAYNKNSDDKYTVTLNQNSKSARLYTQEEVDKAVEEAEKEEREALIEMINYQIVLPEVPKRLFLQAIRARGEDEAIIKHLEDEG